MTLISEIIDLPARINKGDFVLSLSAGVTEPEQTLGSYVVTPQLTACFDDAMSFIRSAVDAGSGKATYLHGSYGAGKSHFMAVLHLLLQRHPRAVAIPELAPVVVKHEWSKARKFLMVPYHMLGAVSVETAILGGYAEYVRRLHPEAPWPGIFLAEGLFANAEELRSELGDAKFLARINRGQAGASDGWGAMEGGWTAETYKAALAAPPKSDDRVRLVGDLVQHLFPAMTGLAAGKEEAVVPLDLGLSILSKHAKSLGYDGLILFLDELILWLASRAADLGFVRRECDKLSKLVEAQNVDRPVPVISFVARQRDLRDFVGESVPGAMQLNFSEGLGHGEGRFHKITLENRNLPLIIQKRVLRPRSPEGAAALESAFNATAKVREEIMRILLTHEGDRQMFRQVYPFSPALVETLVAVSSVLQRERTALKLLLELLDQRRNTLKLGDLVPVGDLWDVIAHGDEAFHEGLRRHFDNAKRLYHGKLRPMLESEHGVSLEHDRPRADSDEAVAAKLRRFDNDDRLLKTLLLAALAPEAKTLKNLTALRLAALNHGTIKAPFPGEEGQIAARKLRQWAARVGEIRVGDEADPTVSLQLAGIDTDAIIENARSFDNPSARYRRVKELVFKAMDVGLPEQESLTELPTRGLLWRGTRRTAEVHYANVRLLSDDSLGNPGPDWRVVVDFPFDEETHTPGEDLDRLARFQARNDPARTLVWLPSFFSRRTLADLGKLLVVENLLRGDSLDRNAAHLSPQDRAMARTILEGQAGSLEKRVQLALEAAYGLRPAQTGELDNAHEAAMGDRHFHSLWPDLTLQPPVGATLADALDHLLAQALSAQYPAHPDFGGDGGRDAEPVEKASNLAKVLEAARGSLADPTGGVVVAAKADRPLLRRIAQPLRLGKMGDQKFQLDPDWRNHFHRRIESTGKAEPAVGDLRAWIDEPRPMGLPREMQNLLILVFAEQTNRSFWRLEGRVDVGLRDLPDNLVLRPQKLPTAEQWAAVRERVPALYGFLADEILSVGTVNRLAAEIRGKTADRLDACRRLPDELRRAAVRIGFRAGDWAETARARTAASVVGLLEALAKPDAADAVAALASAAVETSLPAAAKSLTSAPAVLAALSACRWDILQAAAGVQDDRGPDAESMLALLRAAFAADEYAASAGDALARAMESSTALLAKPAGREPPTPPPPPPGWRRIGEEAGERLDAAAFERMIETLRGRLRADPALSVTLRATLWTREGR